MTTAAQVSSNTLREALVKWERLRLWYNAVMFIVGWSISYHLKWHMDQQAMLGYWGSAVLFGVTANVFFTLGPACECYCLAFRNRGFGRGRIVLFVLGLGVSLAAAGLFSLSLTLMYGAIFGGPR
ncbi:hypothetical protein G5S37_05800 [Roseimicrobium sp. ORNL1]|nr:hypothetical protein G5S37_05800 [Roseimicrobium sp. ORNL1]